MHDLLPPMPRRRAIALLAATAGGAAWPAAAALRERTPLQRLKATVARARPPAPRAVPITVTQGAPYQAVSSFGAQAAIVPAPLGIDVNPNPVTPADLAVLGGFRRAQWTPFDAGFIPTEPGGGSWYRAVTYQHRHASTQCQALAAFHFQFDGAALELLFAGRDVQLVCIADGEYQTPQFIARTLQGGVEGELLAYDTFTRLDFGSVARRRLSVYTQSSLGLRAFAHAGDARVRAWDRSSEPVMSVMADSYGAAASRAWPTAAIFHEAGAALGIAQVDVDAIGGTGYASNSVFPLPGDTFVGRLPGMAALPADLFLVAGGINDNISQALPPYASAQQALAAFTAAVGQYYRDLRAALPGAVIAALGPWQPNEQYLPEVALQKLDIVRAALAATAGPWVLVDNLRGGWLASNGATGPATGPWQTGTGNSGAPHGDGNGDVYVGPDGTHPTAAGASYLAGRIADALRAAIAAL